MELKLLNFHEFPQMSTKMIINELTNAASSAYVTVFTEMN
jgi:hypothetical protein